MTDTKDSRDDRLDDERLEHQHEPIDNEHAEPGPIDSEHAHEEHADDEHAVDEHAEPVLIDSEHAHDEHSHDDYVDNGHVDDERVEATAESAADEPAELADERAEFAADERAEAVADERVEDAEDRAEEPIAEADTLPTEPTAAEHTPTDPTMTEPATADHTMTEPTAAEHRAEDEETRAEDEEARAEEQRDRESNVDALAALGTSMLPGAMTGMTVAPPPTYDTHTTHTYDTDADAEPASLEETTAETRAPEMMPGEVETAPAVGLWDDGAAEDLRDRWQQIQLRFVDDPRAAVDEAERLVTEATDALVATLTARREELSRWRSGGGDDTEQLRVAVQRYREFLDGVLKT